MTKDDLIFRSAVWALVGDDVMTVRPGSQLDTVIKRYANAIDGAPAIDAVPVEPFCEWLNTHGCSILAKDVRTAARLWKQEQETEAITKEEQNE